MAVLCDRSIKRRIERMGMIENAVLEQVRFNSDDQPVLSYGLGPAGYDLRMADEFLVCIGPDEFNAWRWEASRGNVMDPKRFPRHLFQAVSGKNEVLIPPGSFALGYSVERFRIPVDLICVVYGKSTMARCATNPVVTPLEPGWGLHEPEAPQITIEITNNGPYPAKVYSGEGAGQVLFLQLDDEPELAYRGSYNRQRGIVLPRVGIEA